MSPNYQMLYRQEDQLLDEAGSPKSRSVRTWEVAHVDGSPYRRLVARDDKPVSAAEQQFEEQKQRQVTEERRKETPEQRTRRISEWERSQQKRREPLAELADAFDFTTAG